MTRVGDKARRLLLFLLPFGGQDLERDRQLRFLRRQVKERFSNLYSPVSGTLRPAFGEQVAQLRDALRVMQPVLDACFQDQKGDGITDIQKRFVARLLQGKGFTLSQLAFKSIKDEVAEAQGSAFPNAEYVEKVFNVRLSTLTGLKTHAIQQTFAELSHAATIARFDFETLLSPMSSSGDEAGDRELKYRRAPSEEVVELLKDLYYVLADYQPTQQGLKLFRMLSSMTGSRQLDDAEVVRSFAVLQQITEEEMPAEFLEAVVHLTTLDPTQKLPYYVSESHFVETLIDEIIRKFRGHIANYKREVEQRAFQRKIRVLFPDTELPEIEGYTRSVSSRLIDAGLEPFRYIPAARLVKAFSEVHFEPSIKGPLTEFNTKVEYSNDEMRSRVERNLFELRGIGPAFNKLSRDIGDSSLSQLPHILSLVVRGNLTEEQAKKAKGVIADIDRRVDGIIQTSLSNTRELRDFFGRILEDIGQKTPDLVFNHRYLRNTEHALLGTVTTIVPTLTIYLELMSRLTVDTALARKRVKGS